MSLAATKSGAVRKRPGPYSRPRSLAVIDGRTREGRFLRDVRADLLQHVGQKPSPTQLALVERAVMLSLHVAQMDAKATTGRTLTEHDSRTYLAWTNSLTRTLARLGMKGAEASPRTLREHYAQSAIP